MAAIEGRLFVDYSEHSPDDLILARQALDRAKVKYDVIPASDVWTSGGIAFDFNNRKPNGRYSLEGLNEIFGYCTNVSKKPKR